MPSRPAWDQLVASAHDGEPRVHLHPKVKPELEELALFGLADFIDLGDRLVAWLTPAGEREAFPPIYGKILAQPREVHVERLLTDISVAYLPQVEGILQSEAPRPFSDDSLFLAGWMDKNDGLTLDDDDEFLSTFPWEIIAAFLLGVALMGVLWVLLG